MSSVHIAAGGPSGVRRIAILAAALVGLLIFALSLAGCGGSGATIEPAPGSHGAGGTVTTAGLGGEGTVGQGATVQVIMVDRAYDPETVTIEVGDTVVWTNRDAPRHDVVAEDGQFESDLFDEGETFSYTFTEAGTYPYLCTIHPGMTGTVVVQ